MKILVTGGAGFIGSHFVEAFQGRTEEIRVLDNLETGLLSNLEPFRHRFFEGSICDSRRVSEAMEGIDFVIHCAALASVPDCIAQPGKCCEVNIAGLETVLSTAVKHKVKQFAFLSSAAVYGSSPLLPTSEDCPLCPANPYAVSKAQGEELVRRYYAGSDLTAKSFRLFNVYGPRQNPNGGYAAAIPRFISQALRNKPITIHGSGEQTRDFIFVTDVVSAILHALNLPVFGESVNIGTGLPFSILELVQNITSLTGSTSPILFESNRNGDAVHSCASVDRISSTNWRPCTSLLQGLTSTIKWQKLDHMAKNPSPRN
jgi:UDP-glucose 4-epimerase